MLRELPAIFDRVDEETGKRQVFLKEPDAGANLTDGFSVMLRDRRSTFPARLSHVGSASQDRKGGETLSLPGNLGFSGPLAEKAIRSFGEADSWTDPMS